MVLLCVLAAGSACGSSDPSTGGTGGDPSTGGTGGDPGTGGTGGDPGTGGTGGDPGTGGTGGDPGTGGTGGDPGTGGTGGDPGTGGTGGVEEPDLVVVRVAVDPTTLDLVELDRSTLVVTAFNKVDQEVADRPVAWRSSNTSIVSVSATGQVTGNRAGSATITASIDGIEGTATVTVTAGVVAGVTIIGAPEQLGVGDSFQLGATAVDDRDRVLQGRTVTWSSSDPAVAAIDELGWLTGLRRGLVTITAEIEGVQAEAQVEVLGIDAPGRLATGAFHTCWLDDAGAAWCWGSNENGRLGDGTRTNRNVPTPVASDLSFISLAGSYFGTCGITDANELYCWGNDSYQELGGRGESTTPVLVSAGPWAYVTAMRQGFCVVDLDGHPSCWGFNSGDHELGNPSTSYSSVPIPVSPSADAEAFEVVDLRTHYFGGCGLTADASLFCWGYNVNGQVGNGSTTSVAAPVEVLAGRNVETFGLGNHTVCATADGVSYCWGNGSSGQTGTGTSSHKSTPTPIQSDGQVFVAFSGGESHMCGLDPQGAAWCWGSNDRGQLGRVGDSSNVPVPVSGGHVFTTISARENHTCAVADDGVLYCWGANTDGSGTYMGQLGIPGETEVFVPTPVQW